MDKFGQSQYEQENTGYHTDDVEFPVGHVIGYKKQAGAAQMQNFIDQGPVGFNCSLAISNSLFSN